MRDDLFIPYVPRLALEWLRDAPDARRRTTAGSLVFVDLSGFTAMSERLARQGKVGAEEVTGVINATFSELLAEAYRVGGSLLKFGGDALLLFFGGDGHAPRACQAAGRMRATLRSLNPIDTAAGRVRLKMSVGVHSGRFHFFLCGTSHRELFILGPDVTTAVEMESAASSGQILLSPATAALLEPRLVGREEGPGHLLARIPDVAAVDGRAAAEGADAAALIPQGLRTTLGAGAEDAEHRPVTVAFLRFHGVDELLVHRGPAAVERALDALVSRVQEAADELGVSFLGSDVYDDGGKVILTAGAPVVTGEDEERMLLLLRRIFDGHRGLPLAAGVHRGHVFAGSIGPFYRRTYTVMGDAVNTAARIMSRAGPGEVLVSRDVLSRSQTRFETEELPPFAVKGKKEPLVAVRLGRALERADERTSLRLPFVGRADDLAILLEAWAGTRSGHGSSVLITGEAGIGKTRLVDMLLERLAGVRAVRVFAHPYGANVPYAAFGELMSEALRLPRAPGRAGKALADRVARDAPDLMPWLPLLAAPVGASVPSTPEVDHLDPSVRRVRLREMVVRFLAATLPDPALWLVENADLLDEASADLLRALPAAGRPWLVCATAREHETPLGAVATTLRLGPLSSEDAVRLVRAATGERVLPQQAEVLAERSGGNPLFLVELAASGQTWSGDESPPDSLEALVAASVDALPPADRTLLRKLSVLGRRFSPALIETWLGEEAAAVGSRLGRFVEISPASAWFRQAMFQEVAYEGLPFRQRRLLHAEVGALIEAGGRPDDHVDELSLHFHRAGDDERSWRYSLAAARQARDRFAYSEATVLYERALRAARRLDGVFPADLALAREELADALQTTGRFAEAGSAYRAARRTATDPVTQAKLHQREGAIHARLGRPASALRAYGRGIRVLDEAGTDEGRWRLAVGYGAVRADQGRYREALRWAEEGVRFAAQDGDPLALAHAYNRLHVVYRLTGDPRAWEVAEQALRIFEEHGYPSFAGDVLNNLGVMAKEEDRWDEAVGYYRRAGAALRQGGNLLFAAVVEGNVGVVLADQGRLTEAEDIFRDALGAVRAAGYAPAVAWMLRNLGQLAARAGRFEEADEWFAEALEGVAGTPAELTVRAWTAERWVFAGDARRALGAAHEMLEGAPQALRSLLHRVAGYAHLQLGDAQGAEDALRRSLEEASAAGSPYEVALAHEGLAVVAARHGRSGGQHADLAREIFDRLGVVATPEGPLHPRGPRPDERGGDRPAAAR